MIHSPFRIWAPHARSLSLAWGDRTIELTAEDGGWWSAPVTLKAGDEYTVSIDGGPPRPDPRSAFQPRGPHGPSRAIDHSAFPWTDTGWKAPPLHTGLVYEMHVGTYSPDGTFDGAAARLSPLVELGVTHVELMPLADAPGRRGWGYDGVSLFAPHHAYGGPDGLKRFVDACHRDGLAVILDVVYNHLGPSGNYLAEFGPYFTGKYCTPWGAAINLDDKGSDEVRRFLLDNAMQWLCDYHMDGLRIDAVHALFDRSAVPFLEALAEATTELEAELERPLVLIAESDLNDPRVLRPPAMGGYGLHAQWNDDFHHALHVVLTGERTGYYEDFAGLADLAKALRNAYVYEGQHSRHRGHRHGRRPDGLSGHAFLAYMQNHDQVGNRARGERSAHLMPVGRQYVAAAVVLTSPYIPMLFQGEEWGARTPFPYFTDHEDRALGDAVREGRQREFAAFGWRPEDVPDPQAESTFASARLDWEERFREPHASLLAWHRDLVRLRRATPALTDGNREAVRTRFDEQARWLIVDRGPITVACNLGEARRLTIGRAARLRLASSGEIRVSGEDVFLPTDSVAILEA